MSIRSLADFNGGPSWVVRCLVGTDTVIAQGAQLVVFGQRVGTFNWPPVGTLKWPRTALEIYAMAEDGTGLTQLTTGAALTSVPRATDQVPLRVQASYKYDALGRLREITTSQGALAQTIRYGYSGPTDSHSYTTNSSGEIETANWSGTGGLIATAHASAGSYVSSWYYFDQRGDTRAIADGDGQTTWSANYSEYGEIENSSGGSPQYGFVGAYGRISNPATGLVHMGARMYSVNIGRFLSRDPVVGGSANDYEYTGGDPINRLDVSGRRPGRYCDLNGNTVCPPPPPIVVFGNIDTLDTAPTGRYKLVRGAGGQIFVIDTRTGQMTPFDLGDTDVARRIHYYAGISYSEAWQDMFYVNFAGPSVDGGTDFRPQAVTFMRTFKEIPYFAAGTIAAAPVTYGANLAGQVSAYYPEPSPAWGFSLGGLI